MNRSPRGNNKRRNFSGNHQRSWLWGHHAVSETLASGRWPVLQLFLTQSALARSPELLSTAQASGIPVQMVTPARIEELAHTSEHQGLLARLGPYSYTSWDQFESQLVNRIEVHRGASEANESRGSLSNSWPLVVICDRIQDNHNFGAILRSCDATRALCVIIGTSHQSAMTPHVVRSSSGAANHVTVVATEDLVGSARKLQRLGVRLVAADTTGKQSLWQADLRSTIGLVLGSEAFGIAPELLEICDQRLIIPMAGAISSLNVAVAAGVMLYEIRRQQTLSS